MGCDIHLHVEIKVKGRWLHWNHPQIERDYQLFGKMAGVRDEDEEPIAKPRGIPEDIAETTLWDYDCDGDDAHTASWLSASEAAAVEEWYAKLRGREHRLPRIFGYAAWNTFGCLAEYPGDKDVFRGGFEDARIVFWFNN